MLMAVEQQGRRMQESNMIYSERLDSEKTEYTIEDIARSKLDAFDQLMVDVI